MPLHLLGKKSWNVYNPENVARVRRDEAQAKAQEEEQERQMQEVDAERRIQILRGERPPTPPPPPSLPSLPSSTTQPEKSHREETGRFRKRRRLAGENDTDRDIRFAREDAEFAVAKREELAVSRVDDAPLEDSAGHINLFPSKGKDRAVEKNAEAEAESADQKRKYEDQYTMRFSNAAGFKQSIGQKPWYHSSADGAMAPDSVPGKDVWGNEDPLRKQREAARMDANDPLAAMRKGVRQLKSVEQERKRWNDERYRELSSLRETEKQQSHYHRRRRRRSRSRSPASDDSLEGFKLDGSPDSHREDKDRKRSSHRDHRHHRDRSRDRSHRRLHSHSHSRHHHRDRHESRRDDTRHSRRPRSNARQKERHAEQ
ncbi:hypothetical protein ASPWEDRAFT_371493 [Aspergillus wentii DTO 134E9]|uniref:CBF1-interacting co-repressor CIR N-terminal domain-containing protein n=1 Tax=Aspergillus wentii DTO 134E9 TaxID=1073089 RepID=A0A1L9RWR2_ASPWE|nr:uncharacterized protein ASPWEDRAFT_371493 [Aspergillus wentii DTO 134E9]OJJ39380.1 hypothetical protein ASPWEDRAFT_371493 [Aspergillus wentii DTO 134E9]